MAHKILAIDDHPETLSIVVATLQGHGYHVISSQSPFKGLTLAETEKPDLILVDMQMPDMNGIEVCQKVRANPDLAHIPIIMFTAMGAVEQKMAGFDAGVDDYIIKPTEPSELIARVEALLENVPDSRPNDTLSSPSAANHTLFVEQRHSGFSMPLSTSDETGTEHLIAVLGARGGIGTTTVAINLAYAIMETECPTTLLDLDFMQGHISLYLNQKHFGGINEIANAPHGQLAQYLRAQFVPYKKNLQLLLAHPNLNGHYALPTTDQLMLTIDALMKPGHCVVVDLGQGINKFATTILERASQVIVCLGPERIALAAAKRLLEHLPTILFPGTTLHTLMFDISGGVNLPQNAVAGYLGHPLFMHISASRKELAQAVNKGVTLIQSSPQSQTTLLFRQLAQQLIKALNE